MAMRPNWSPAVDATPRYFQYHSTTLFRVPGIIPISTERDDGEVSRAGIAVESVVTWNFQSSAREVFIVK
jgi:hypothetical protein